MKYPGLDAVIVPICQDGDEMMPEGSLHKKPQAVRPLL